MLDRHLGNLARTIDKTMHDVAVEAHQIGYRKAADEARDRMALLKRLHLKDDATVESLTEMILQMEAFLKHLCPGVVGNEVYAILNNNAATPPNDE